MQPKYESHPIQVGEIKINNSLIVTASGFEDRDYRFISEISPCKNCCVVLLKFKNRIKENNVAYKKFKNAIEKKFHEKNIFESTIEKDKEQDFESDFKHTTNQLPYIEGDVWLDISGMPAYTICSTIKSLRESFPQKTIKIIYTSAINYFPTKDEYDEVVRRNKEHQSRDLFYVPQSMALEMSKNLVLDSFSGHRTSGAYTCLAIFPGYEPHRSSGVIDDVNPSKLLLIYGIPQDKNLSWRLDLSKSLHSRFQKSRNCAIETTCTFDINQSLSILGHYYSMMFDNHDFIVSAVCSKMQTVASFLFWESNPEVQLVFPLPIGYDPKKSPQGVGKTYLTKIPPKATLFK